jgi:NTE family protein
MQDTPYEKFKDKSPIDYLGIPGKAVSLLVDKGIYEGDYFCNWYHELLSRKQVSYFGDLKLDGEYKFVAVAANITRGKLLRFPMDLTSLGIDIDSQSVARAVRASISIPFFYEPVMLKSDYLVDGGILSNYPIDTFSDDKIPTIGIKLSAEPGAIDKPKNITGAWSYASAIVGTMLSVQDQIHLNDPDAVARTIFVDTGDVMATDFGITEEDQQMLYESGKAAALKYLDKL